MTPIYEVKTKHTDKVLKDFIKFRYKMKSPGRTAMIIVFGICLYTLAYMSKDRLAVAVPCVVLGTIIIIFAFARLKIIFSRLAKNDPNYQKQSDIVFVFGEKEFTIEDGESAKPERVSYGEIAYLYVDKEYFFVSINNEMVHLLPKRDFVLGTADGFYDFISDKTQKDILPLSIPWKTRIRLMMEYRDVKAEEMRRQQDEKKKK